MGKCCSHEEHFKQQIPLNREKIAIDEEKIINYAKEIDCERGTQYIGDKIYSYLKKDTGNHYKSIAYRKCIREGETLKTLHKPFSFANLVLNREHSPNIGIFFDPQWKRIIVSD